jgi:CRP-like cAMP-binding protein
VELEDSTVVALEDSTVVALEDSTVVVLEVDSMVVALEVEDNTVVALEDGNIDVALEVGSMAAALEADSMVVENKQDELLQAEARVQLTVLEFDGDEVGDEAVVSGFLEFDSFGEMVLHLPEYSHGANVEQIDILKRQLAVTDILASYWRTDDQNYDAS